MYNVFPMLSIIESKYMYYELINCCKGSKKRIYVQPISVKSCK